MATEQSILAVIRAARPSFRNRYDKAAFALHAAFLSAGYVLNATGAAAFTDDALSSSSTDEVGMDNWNEVGDSYAFIYSNPQKGSKKVLVKCIVMDDKLLVDAIENGDDSEPVHLEINVGEYVEENGGTNYSSQYKNLGKLSADVNIRILDKLDGSSAAGSSARQSSFDKNLREDRDPRPSVGIAVRDEPYIAPPSGYIVPPIPDSRHGDLLPGLGAGMYPARGDFGGGSNMIGPDDPIFFSGSRQPGLPGGLPGVPPGARFDPYGPPGVPGFEPGRFVRNPRRPGGGGHPDLHHFHDGSDFI